MGDKFGYSLVFTDAVAQSVRDNILPELLKAVKEEIEGEWQVTLPNDTERREQIYHELHALTRVQLRVQAVLDSLKMKGY